MVANEVICNNISANGSAECKGGDTLIFFVNGVKVNVMDVSFLLFRLMEEDQATFLSHLQSDFQM